jgi:hypothetical protein
MKLLAPKVPRTFLGAVLYDVSYGAWVMIKTASPLELEI